ncbi:MAG: NAD(+) diphosphatase [Betaproteobacteria bacterium]|nr:NAD(+) diphosphatase [Betaproteobacteria bacterium]
MNSEFLPLCHSPQPAPGAGLWFVFCGERLLASEGTDAAQILDGDPPPARGLALLRWQYLGRLGERDCYSGEVEAETPAPAGMDWYSLRRLFARLSDELFGLAARAYQIVEWDRAHQFCGGCGQPTRLMPGERARECPNCGRHAYPRLSPVVMILVRDGKRLLLARSPRFVPEMFSALAGFVEPGESLEETAHREVREEVGVEIANLRYFASQSWPFPHSMMIAFTADYAGGELKPDLNEIEAAGWYEVDALPMLPHRVSIARRLIDAVVAEIRSGGSS